MLIRLSPQRRDDQYTLAVSGESLIINGEGFDFAPVEEGDVLEAGAVASDYIVGAVTRTAGQLEVTLILPHGPNAPEATRFPAPIYPANGPVTLPLYDEEPTDE